MLTLGLLLTAVICSWALTAYLSRLALLYNLVDTPNQRSLHQQAIPLIGGVAMLLTLAGFLLLANIWFKQLLLLFPYHVWLPLLLVAVVSYWDDYRPLRADLRLLAHFIASFWLLAFGGMTWIQCISAPMLAIMLSPTMQFIISSLFIVWMINLYNFMDGMDGSAAGMTVIGFSSLAILGLIAGIEEFVLLNGLIVAVTLGFLYFNFPPAKVFMGDTGASSLGYLAALMLLWGLAWSIVPLWIGILIFSPFIVDATVTLVRRFFSGQKIWLAHREHYYQRLIQLGWGHKKTVLWQYVLMLACSLSAISAIFVNQFWQAVILIIWILIYIFLALKISQLEWRHEQHSQNNQNNQT
jgi:UDP-N-acetylmuramyl pentapeptide phosphotransferase/UDP-N-acetylglucosamine-1-phosphate transferase